jgi:hypothetical protein
MSQDIRIAVNLHVGDQSVLLIFKRGASLVTQTLPGGPGMPEGEMLSHDGGYH